jgi:hypothetical protein
VNAVCCLSSRGNGEGMLWKPLCRSLLVRDGIDELRSDIADCTFKGSVETETLCIHL